MTGGGGGTSATGPGTRDRGACAGARGEARRERDLRATGQPPRGRAGCGRRVPEARRRRATPSRPPRCRRRSPTGRRSRAGRRAARATGSRSGRRDAQGLDNEYRDRGVYNAGTPDFSGRIAHVAIDPDCRENGRCTLWIANANGGVWRTNEALDATPKWQYVSSGFEHNNTASIELDPNDKQGRVALRRNGRAERVRLRLRGRRRDLLLEERRQLVGRPPRPRELQQPRRRLDRRQARRLEDDLRRLGPCGPRCLERLLRRRGRAHPGRAALRALPLDERRRVVGAREPGRSGALHRDATRRRLARRHAVLAAWRAARDDRPGRPEHRLRVVLRAWDLALERRTATGHVDADLRRRSAGG